MSVDSKHPEYIEHEEEWRIVRDTYRGAYIVKRWATEYLPMPSGFAAQGDNGTQMYNAYRKRAQFPEIVAPTVQGIIGIIHGNEWQIELPSSMDFIYEDATPEHISLDSFAKRVTTEALLMGRYGILTDVRENQPYLAGYKAETVINWDENRDFYVLDESDLVRTNFEWDTEEKYRVLELADGRYRQRVYIDGRWVEEIEPSARGARFLDEIPFVIVGAKDLRVEIEEPPLIGVARAALAHYRLDADYRHQLYMSGQETLFIINGEAPSAVGAGVVHRLEAPEGVTVDAKYVGPSGNTIEAHRVAMKDEMERAANIGARLLDDSSRAQESGDARRLRFGSETASLKTIAVTVASGLEKSLKYAARMIGANEDEVIVTPPSKLMEPVMSAQEAKTLVEAWQQGGFSYQTLYENLQRGQIASQDRTFEDELQLLDETPAPDERGLL